MDNQRSRIRMLYAGLAAMLACASLTKHVDAVSPNWSSVVSHAVSGTLLAQVETDPEAIFTISPAQPLIGQAFRVDASQSYDRPTNDPIARYSWTWGDGTDASTGVSVLHTYTKAGRFTITLTVFDANNASDTATKTVEISGTTPGPGGSNKAPVPSLIISPTEGFAGEEFTMDARGSRDPDNDPIVYRFNFGDGEITDFTSTAIVTHSYDEPGNYVVRLTVRDDQNASVDLTGTVHVLGADDNQAPVALIATGPRVGAAPVTLSFDGSISYDPDGDPIAYDWSFFLDGEPYDTQTGDVANQLFDQPGSYSVVLEVRDIFGLSNATAPLGITITEGGDPVEPPPPAPIPEPEDPPPSYEQRPDNVCGVGMLLPMLACLMCMAGIRRRS